MADNSVPAWIDSKLFANVLRETVGDFKEIREFKAFPALAPGENYATLMLKIQIEVMLKNGSVKTQSFMLKVAHDNEMYRNELSKWDMFTTESGMYRHIVPEFEKLYADVGLNVQFGAKSYELPVQKEYILLEDLSKKGFKNSPRQNCLDMDHCKSVLKKIAQWHAASVVRKDKFGAYEKRYTGGIFIEGGQNLCRQMLESALKHLLKSSKKLKGYQEYYKQLECLKDKLTDFFYEQTSLDANEFNVLNHGDCWSNNIMFRYDEDGKLLETYLVDLQIPTYGNPGQDLLYFIISSAQLDIKIDKFDYMINYYYKHLIDHLTILKYAKPLPTLRDIQRCTFKAGAYGLLAVLLTMPVVLCDPTDTATADNLVGDSEEGDKFKELMFSNDRVSKHLEIVLPWMFYRGVFEQ